MSVAYPLISVMHSIMRLNRNGICIWLGQRMRLTMNIEQNKTPRWVKYVEVLVITRLVIPDIRHNDRSFLKLTLFHLNFFLIIIPFWHITLIANADHVVFFSQYSHYLIHGNVFIVYNQLILLNIPIYFLLAKCIFFTLF